MASKKEIMQKRWLLGVALLFQVIFPLAIIIEVVAKSNQVAHTKIPCIAFILGCLYIGFVSRIVKEKSKKMKPSPLKVALQEVNYIIPFIVVGCIVYLAQTSLEGFDYYMYFIVGSIVFGSVLKVIEYIINSKFIHKQEVYEKANELVEIEQAKKYLEQQVEEESE